MKPKPNRFTLMVLLLIAISLVACGKSTPTLPQDLTSPGIAVGITGSDCPSMNVVVGDQVTWTNQDNREHLIRIQSPEEMVVFEAGNLQPGDTASFTFAQAGEYSYICSQGEEQIGTIVVQP
jgi:hypothetical protein